MQIQLFGCSPYVPIYLCLFIYVFPYLQGDTKKKTFTFLGNTDVKPTGFSYFTKSH